MTAVRARGIGGFKQPTSLAGNGNDPHGNGGPQTIQPAFQPGPGYRPCADPRYDPDWWFAAPSDPTGHHATALCRVCPIRKPCATWALTTEEPHGIYGGLTETDRQRILRQSRSA